MTASAAMEQEDPNTQQESVVRPFRMDAETSEADREQGEMGCVETAAWW